MNPVHRYLAYVVPAGFLLVGLWAIVAFIRNKTPGENFWRLVAFSQVLLGIQILIGVVLYLVGRRPSTTSDEWLHYTYGALFPLFLLVLAHRYGRRQEGIAWIAFGIVALLNFGLTFRALQTTTFWGS